MLLHIEQQPHGHEVVTRFRQSCRLDAIGQRLQLLLDVGAERRLGRFDNDRDEALVVGVDVDAFLLQSTQPLADPLEPLLSPPFQ
jgi:hypothetical protein